MNKLIKGITYSFNRNTSWQDRTIRTIMGVGTTVGVVYFFDKNLSDLSEQKLEGTLLTVDDLYARLYRDHPFKVSKKAESIVQEIIGDSQLHDVFKLGD